MPTLALQAHYDGQRIVLDEPYALPANASLMVTVLPAATESSLDDEAVWLGAMRSNDAFAFLAEPEEDIYTLEDGQPLSDAL